MVCYTRYNSVKVKIIAHLTVFGAIFILLFSVYMFIIGNYPNAIIELSVALLGLTSLKYFARKKKVDIIANIDIALLFLLFLYLFVSGGYKGTGLLWMYCIPVAVLFTKGNKKGLICLIGYFTVVLVFIALHFLNILNLKFSNSLIIMFVLSFIVLSFFIYSFERMKERAEKLLHEKMIEIKKLNRELKHLSSYDSLTQVYNRRMIMDEIEKEIDRFKRYNHQFCVALLDIDHFKIANDTYGHQFGDEVLTTICNIIKSNVLRKTDSIGRYGGEEFLVLIPETELNGANVLAKRIKNQISKINFISPGQEKVTITASLGIAQYEKYDDIESILTKADKALYKAKHNGRNRVEQYKEAG